MPDDPLQHWPFEALPFRGPPRLLRPLQGGLSNASYLVEVDSDRYVLRLNAAEDSRYGIDRYRERQLLQQAADAGIAPEVIFCAPDEGILITRFLDGRHWQPEDARDPEHLERLLLLLERVHQLQAVQPAMDYPDHMQHYCRTLREAGDRFPEGLQEQQAELEAMLRQLAVAARPVAVCHHDPTPVNIIDNGGRLFLLDWEYAAPGWPAFDFAVIDREWGVETAMLVEQSGVDREELQNAVRLYDHLCRLWWLLQQSTHAV